jgi:hypothetical protein
MKHFKPSNVWGISVAMSSVFRHMCTHYRQYHTGTPLTRASLNYMLELMDARDKSTNFTTEPTCLYAVWTVDWIYLIYCSIRLDFFRSPSILGMYCKGKPCMYTSTVLCACAHLDLFAVAKIEKGIHATFCVVQIIHVIAIIKSSLWHINCPQHQALH